jgi:hypothetical protein
MPRRSEGGRGERGRRDEDIDMEAGRGSGASSPIRGRGMEKRPRPPETSPELLKFFSEFSSLGTTDPLASLNRLKQVCPGTDIKEDYFQKMPGTPWTCKLSFLVGNTKFSGTGVSGQKKTSKLEAGKQLLQEIQESRNLAYS